MSSAAENVCVNRSYFLWRVGDAETVCEVPFEVQNETGIIREL